MSKNITLFSGKEDETLEVEVGDAYELLLKNLESNEEINEQEQIARMIETTIHKSIQSMVQGSEEISKPHYKLIQALQETEEIDLQSVVENSIHTLDQQIE